MGIEVVDKNEYQGTTHYPIANESVRRWEEVLQGTSVDTVGGIAGGGEISLFSILPCAKKRAIFVDHSYVSLWALIGKYGTIEKRGPEEAHALCTSPIVHINGGYNAQGRRVKGGKYNQYGEIVDNNPYSHKLVDKHKELYSCFLEANKGLTTETDRMEECGWWPLPQLPQKWAEVTVEDCDKLLKSKVDLQILHGDISDLTEFAPVDLLYLSNALQYQGRDGKAFKLEEIVQKGSLIAFTSSNNGLGYTHPTLKTKVVQSFKPHYDPYYDRQRGVPSTRKWAPTTVQDGSWGYHVLEVQ